MKKIGIIISTLLACTIQVSAKLPEFIRSYNDEQITIDWSEKYAQVIEVSDGCLKAEAAMNLNDLLLVTGTFSGSLWAGGLKIEAFGKPQLFFLMMDIDTGEVQQLGKVSGALSCQAISLGVDRFGPFVMGRSGPNPFQYYLEPKTKAQQTTLPMGMDQFLKIEVQTPSEVLDLLDIYPIGDSGAAVNDPNGEGD